MKWGGGGNGEGQFNHATGIAVDLNGNIFVADYENKRVQKFDSNGNFIITWKMGEDMNLKGIPEGIAVDAEGTVYITDYSLGRMQVFDNDGSFLWALSGEKILDMPFKRPTGIALDAGRRLFVVNQAANNVAVYQLP